MPLVTFSTCTTCSEPAITAFVIEIRDSSDSVLETVTELTASAVTPGVSVTQNAGATPDIDVNQSAIQQALRVCFVSYTTSCGTADINDCVDIPQETPQVQRCINGMQELDRNASTVTAHGGGTLIHDDGYLYRFGYAWSDFNHATNSHLTSRALLSTDTFGNVSGGDQDEYAIYYHSPTRLPWFYNNEPTLTFTKVETTEDGTFALASDGRLFTWGGQGSSTAYQAYFGRNPADPFDLTTAWTPFEVPFPGGVTGWTDFVTQVNPTGNTGTTYALGDDGNVYAFGQGRNESQLGRGATAYAWFGGTAIVDHVPTVASRITPAPDELIAVWSDGGLLYNSGGTTYLYGAGYDPPLANPFGASPAVRAKLGQQDYSMVVVSADGSIGVGVAGASASQPGALGGQANPPPNIWQLYSISLPGGVGAVDVAHVSNDTAIVVGTDGDLYFWDETTAPFNGSDNIVSGGDVNLWAPYTRVWSGANGNVIVQKADSSVYAFHLSNPPVSAGRVQLSTTAYQGHTTGIFGDTAALGYQPYDWTSAGISDEISAGGPWPACAPPSFYTKP